MELFILVTGGYTDDADVLMQRKEERADKFAWRSASKLRL